MKNRALKSFKKFVKENDFEKNLKPISTSGEDDRATELANKAKSSSVSVPTTDTDKKKALDMLQKDDQVVEQDLRHRALRTKAVHVPHPKADKKHGVKSQIERPVRENVVLEEYKDPDQHFAKQSKPMQSAINMHLRKGKNYWDAVRAAKVHVKEDLAVPLLGSHDDDESAEMAKAQLKALANKSLHLVMQMSDEMILEPWVQAKINLAKDYITTVHDYMIYGDHEEQEDESDTAGAMQFPNVNIDNAGYNV